ncbi:pentatricopeptide repeat-containing protein At3g50420-like [Salvia splendens]|uniref:pentatricopeptide repeat-containing protein At3g50420-like n=1 Tax=Salvia splendens TaxID=180675 RepID=UPI001C27FDAE|nr:pentatricopeptide repeat-containing protein At3g50420-like [Salvia splendens]
MPPSFPASHLLRKCAATTSLREARRLHAVLLTTTLPPTETPLFLHNNILSMYARCGSLEDAHLLLDEMPHRNIVSYNALIAAYSRRPHHAHHAFHLLDQLAYEGHVPNGSTVTSLLQASAALCDLVAGASLHARCAKTGFLDNVRIQTSLLGMYFNCGDADCAKRVFTGMKDKDAIAWNSVISGYVKNGKILGSVELFQSMLEDEVKPNSFTYSLALNACAKLRDYDNGRLVHAQILLSGTCVDLPLHNSLLDMYSSCGDTCSASDVFRRIGSPDLVSWNTMIGGFAENGEGEKAMEMFVQLRQACHVKPDEYTFAAIIAGTCGFPARDYGMPLHAQAEKARLMSSAYVSSTLLSMYFNNGDSASPRKIFSSFEHKDAVLWTDVIAGHVRIGESEGALSLFLEMTKEGLGLDSFVLSSALAACADLVTLRQGEMVHSLVLKTGNDAEVWVHSSLVDMYAKNGELGSAAYAFSCLPKCDLMCWNSMLTGCGHHGRAKEAFQVYFKMLKHGLNPDQVTFLSLLAACNHCGLVHKSRFFWRNMKEHHARAGPKHYSCIISLLSRAGLWEEAEEMIVESPFADDYLESWRTVLSSCIKNRDLRGGIHAAEQILETNAEDSAANVLLAKLYAATGRWGDVAETRRNMKNSLLEKEPGLSWIEVRNSVRVFSSGEQSQLQRGEVEAEIGNLLGNMMPTVAEDIIQGRH